MSDDQQEPTQLTQPVRGEPVEIPVPAKADVLGFLAKVARTPDPERSADTSE